VAHSHMALGEYLRARRRLVRPADVGLPVVSGRRVEGLRREEVAALAGISPEYYLRLERGKDVHPSPQVVRALGRALQLDPLGRRYLARLARGESPAVPSTTDAAAPIVADLIRPFGGVPAYVTDSNLDVVAANEPARLIGGRDLSPGENRVVWWFGSTARASIPDWRPRAAQVVGALRWSGQPEDARFRSVVGTLMVRDHDFRDIWAMQDVHAFNRGDLVFAVEPFGLITFDCQSMISPVDDRFTVHVLYARRGSPAAAVLAYLGAGNRSGDGEQTEQAVVPAL
jgi:transcriptional regulator with XRE-family HTH domain